MVRALSFAAALCVITVGLLVVAEGWIVQLVQPIVTTSEHVETLNDTSIKDFITRVPSALVLFYAPWCRWCRDLLPHFADAADLLHSQGLSVKLAQIDAALYRDIAEEYDIRAFPTLRFYLDGHAHEYSGGRTRQDLVNWVTLHLQTELKLNDATQLEAFVKSHRGEPALIARILTDSAEARNTFVRASRKVDHVGFAEITNNTLVGTLITDLHAPAEIRSRPSFVLMLNPHAEQDPATEQSVVLYHGALTDGAGLETFIKTFLFPAFVDFDSQIATRAFTDGRPVWIVVTDPAKQEDPLTLRAIQVSRDLARIYRNRMIFVHCHGDTVYDKRLYNILAIDEDERPTICLVNANPEGHARWYSTLKFRPSTPLLQTMDKQGLERFIADYFKGTLQPFVKSEPVPDPGEDKGPVYTLVASEFHRTVMESPYDVIVDFYAPWCGHCRKLEPVYRQFATLLRPFKHIRVMRMDATRNEVNLRIAGYPTIVMFPAKSPPQGNEATDQPKQAVYYLGKRDVNSLLEWVVAEGSKRLTVTDVMKAQQKAEGARGSNASWFVEEL